ncbi:hypothetical protein BJ138DRAFT_1138545 [Hygrophoropsis aurantiaca]|uniref:Uncharacterized protein n=1 Tax=Hygrophoropsis aurantiaca TaxID=72124 RepID=A0ACB7ZVN1_9AGAM|nr:hypothetical protein BJ138DRAFT_1138545 [Hygrophoropsis aurantiaca]
MPLPTSSEPSKSPSFAGPFESISSGSGYIRTCVCGRSFFQPNAFSTHERSCSRTKKRLSGALVKAKELWSSRKRQRVMIQAANESGSEIARATAPIEDVSQSDLALEAVDQSVNQNAICPSSTNSNDDPGLSLAECRPRRENRRMPQRYRDVLPHQLSAPPPPGTNPPVPSPNLPAAILQSQVSGADASPPTIIPRLLETARNKFGLFRRFVGDKFPSHDPEEYATATEPTNPPSLLPQPSLNADTNISYHPYPNHNSFRLGEWYWNGSAQKSKASFKELLDIIKDPDFDTKDIEDTNWRQVDQLLADGDSEDEWIGLNAANWTNTPITLSVPFSKKSTTPGPKDFVAGEFYHRSIVSPQRSGATQDAIQVHGELYTSPAFIDAHNNVQNLPGEPGCDRPRVIIALQFWSDSTHLTSFGNAKLWPLYLWFGNESKYRRCKPSCHLCNHVAYFQPLPDSFKDFVAKHAGGKGPARDLMTHCHREFLHAQWDTLLDDEILLACIRNMGGCPCPRCLIPLSRVPDLGMARDMAQRRTLARTDDAHRRNAISNARKLIYEQGWAVDSAPVERLLKPDSLVPTANAFSGKLTPLGVDIFVMFIVDLLHEVEIGAWKALFIHLLWILEALSTSLIHKLDQRYRQVRTFGQSTIRRFSRNSSELKKMAARDYEDLLQCAIPVFDGLLTGKHNKCVLRLLFIFAHWHALAKLRMHTDATLALLDRETISLGAILRDFQKGVCPAFNTRELKREADAQMRRSNAQNNESQKKSKTVHEALGDSSASPNELSRSTRRPKTLNLHTYKFHALAPHARWYTRTSRKQYVKQMTQIERRQTRIRSIHMRLGNQAKGVPLGKDECVVNSLEVHHVIGSSQNIPWDIPSFVQKYAGDPAIREFVPQLKKHLLPRIRAILQSEIAESQGPTTYDGHAQVSSEDNWHFVFFKNKQMYEHKLMRINYTTYDVQRAQDVGTASNDPEDCVNHHPFLYAQLLGIFHANVIYTGPGTPNYNPHHVGFLWVRWYKVIDDIATGWDARTLDRVCFLPMANEDAFGFLDPKDVLRSCHLIPAFASGKRHADGVGLSRCVSDSDDWRCYYVNRFVDRDMVMRYHVGLGVGHIHATPPLDSC